MSCFLLRLVMVVFFFASGLSAYAFENIAYVETNDTALSNAGCFTLANGQPFFSEVVIFAANIHGKSVNSPTIYLNKYDNDLLNRDEAVQVQKLHSRGVDVLVALLGDYQPAGWSCMDDDTSIVNFAAKIAEFVKKYNLDGVAIDDEYSNCSDNETSILKIVSSLRANKDFQNKKIQMVLLNDNIDKFGAEISGHSLGGVINSAVPGWYDSEGSFGGQLSWLNSIFPAVKMSKNSVYGSVDVADYSSPVLAQEVSSVNAAGYGGLMLYSFGGFGDSAPAAAQFGSRSALISYVEQIAQAEYGPSLGQIAVAKNCLIPSKWDGI